MRLPSWQCTAAPAFREGRQKRPRAVRHPGATLAPSPGSPRRRPPRTAEAARPAGQSASPRVRAARGVGGRVRWGDGFGWGGGACQRASYLRQGGCPAVPPAAHAAARICMTGPCCASASIQRHKGMHLSYPAPCACRKAPMSIQLHSLHPCTPQPGPHLHALQLGGLEVAAMPRRRRQHQLADLRRPTRDARHST